MHGTVNRVIKVFEIYPNAGLVQQCITYLSNPVHVLFEPSKMIETKNDQTTRLNNSILLIE